MESGFINSLLRRNEKAHNEAFAEEEKPFMQRVNDSYENKALLEFKDAVLDARKFGKTFDELITKDEEELERDYGSKMTDMAVALGVLKQLEEIEKFKTKG